MNTKSNFQLETHEITWCNAQEWRQSIVFKLDRIASTFYLNLLIQSLSWCLLDPQLSYQLAQPYLTPTDPVLRILTEQQSREILNHSDSKAIIATHCRLDEIQVTIVANQDNIITAVKHFLKYCQIFTNHIHWDEDVKNLHFWDVDGKVNYIKKICKDLFFLKIITTDHFLDSRHILNKHLHKLPIEILLTHFRKVQWIEQQKWEHGVDIHIPIYMIKKYKNIETHQQLNEEISKIVGMVLTQPKRMSQIFQTLIEDPVVTEEYVSSILGNHYNPSSNFNYQLVNAGVLFSDYINYVSVGPGYREYKAFGAINTTPDMAMIHVALEDWNIAENIMTHLGHFNRVDKFLQFYIYPNIKNKPNGAYFRETYDSIHYSATTFIQTNMIYGFDIHSFFLETGVDLSNYTVLVKTKSGGIV